MKMRQDHTLQAQRFELKYLLPDCLSPAIRSRVRNHLELDEFCSTSPSLSYPIHSIYLDSDDLTTYRWAANDDHIRFKLRIRYYNEKPESPIFLEIKRRVNGCVCKQRCPVRREAVASLDDGVLAPASELLAEATSLGDFPNIPRSAGDVAGKAKIARGLRA
jgi:VTC domain